MPKENAAQPAGGSYAVIDGHVDILYLMTHSHPETPFEDLEDSPVTLEKMKAGNVRVIVAALYCPDTYNARGSSAYLQYLVDHADKYLAGFVPILSVPELENCLKQEPPGKILLVENSDCLLEADLDRLIAHGIKVAGLTHMGRNRIGDGNAVPFPEGLSTAGKELVRKLGSEGFAIDVAHLAEPGFRDLVRLHEKLLVSSHTGVRALCDTPRNLTREQVGIILDRKGVIGIAADPKMLSVDGVASIEDIFRHIDWIAQRFETDGIGIGSDFCGFHTPNTGMEDISKLADLADLLLRYGYPEESVRGILGMNWFRFYRSLI